MRGAGDLRSGARRSAARSPTRSMSRVRSSGTTVWRTVRLPSGCSSTPGLVGALPRTRRAGASPAGSCACQARGVGERRAAARRARRRGRRSSAASPPTSVTSKRTEKSHQRISKRRLAARPAAAAALPARPSTVTLNRLREPRLSCTLARNSARKWNGSELDQHVEADVALDAEAVARPRTGWRRRRTARVFDGDREIGLADEPRVVAGGQRELRGGRRSGSPPAARTAGAGRRPRARSRRGPSSAMRIAIAPVSTNVAAEPRVVPAPRRARRCPASKSRMPTASMLSRTQRRRCGGRIALTRPRMISRSWLAPLVDHRQLELDQRRRGPADLHQWARTGGCPRRAGNRV